MTVLGCLFALLLGCCVGSFLNVIIYRLPEGLSIVRPGSHCPKCKNPISWYDNIPLLSWLLLGRSCRRCGQRISAVYPLVELVTGAAFAGLFLAYMVLGMREVMPRLIEGPGASDWAALGLHFWLIGALIASAVIDFRLSVIPLSITSLTAVLAVVWHGLLPQALLGRISSGTAGLAVGACLGLIVSAVLVRTGILRPSFQQSAHKGFAARPRRKKSGLPGQKGNNQATVSDEPSVTFNARPEVLREILYLLPAIVLGIAARLVVSGDTSLAQGWQTLLANNHANAICASLFGLLVAGGTVWLTRIAGTLAFGREAMGLGDVHLMAAAGAVLGWLTPVLAFFIAPFFGLVAVLLSSARQRAGELPYGPWLALGVLTAMVFQDRIWTYMGPGLELVWELLVG